MKPEDWIWMPHPGHFICGRSCQFHLTTHVGNYIVSTVGEYFPDSRVREIFAKSRGVRINGMGDAWDADYMRKIGYEELGYGRLYETMVFPSVPSEDECCPFKIRSGSEVDAEGYNDPAEARRWHLHFCRKWADHPELPIRDGELEDPRKKLRRLAREAGISLSGKGGEPE